MFLEAAQARREVARNFARLNYQISQQNWQSVCMGVKRDLQARKLRPNVAVPSRRHILSFIRTIRAETGSLAKAISSILHDGPWTSSGGSFRLAEAIGVDIASHAHETYEAQRRLVYLEIGGGWAGFWGSSSSGGVNDISGLAHSFRDQLGKTVFLHFTNLTKWHANLPTGVDEHPHVTAASLGVLEEQGVQSGTVDILYSQAAAYFEPDYEAFFHSAARLLSPGGIMIFNHLPALARLMDALAKSRGLELQRRIELGGMNGTVSHYRRG
ncbi:MAG: methyltransferase domain-containing protein [Pseudomonadota bacterium]